MFHSCRLRVASLRGLVLLLCGVALPAAAQEEFEGARVERLTWRGVEDADRGELQQSIVTEETRCRSLLLRPICWVTTSPLFVERHYLDTLELRRDELRVRVFYWRRGYRDAQAAAEIVPRENDRVEVVFHVEEGEPTRIESLEVRQPDTELRRRHIRRARLPGVGEPLNLILLDSAVTRLRDLLWDRGFAHAEVHDTAFVDNATDAARVEITLDPGRRVTVGEIAIQGNQRIEERTIRRMLALREGQLLRRPEVVASQRRLYESGLFQQADIDLPPEADTVQRIEVAVREAPPRVARLGGGFNRIDFIQTEARFTHFNWLGGARRLDLRGALGNLLAEQLTGSFIFRDMFDHVERSLTAEEERAYLAPTWQASAEIAQPFFLSFRNTLSLSVFASRRSVPGVVIDRSHGAGATFSREVGDRVPLSLNYRFEVTATEAGDVYFCVNYGVCDRPTIDALQQNQQLAPVALSLLANRADDLQAPTSGYRARADLEHASNATLSDYAYNRVSAELTRYFPFGPRRVLSARARGGWIGTLAGGVRNGAEAEHLEPLEARLHPRKRFYAGGSRSVRGYGENQLGPRILTIEPDVLREAGCGENLADCPAETLAEVPSDEFLPRPLGGASVIEGNLEYRHPLWGPLDGAVFLDGAIVAARGENLFSGGTGAVTPGFGIRYSTPVGAIRVDLGVRPRLTQELPVVTEVVDADGERSIVQLQARKLYDPLEHTGGTLRQVLNRLTLHLSIGQAF